MTRRLLPKILLAIGVGVVAWEVGLRIIDWRAGRSADFYMPRELGTTTPLYRTHPFMGYELTPNYSTPRGNIHVNALGMRGGPMTLRKPPGTYRIFCLGGSTTFGTAATDDLHTYPYLLEQYLNRLAPAGMKYEVGNCGVSGYTSVENLIQLQLRLVEYSPDAILYYEAANDARPIQARGFLPDYAHVRRAWTQETITPFEKFLIRYVRTYAWLARGHEPEQQVGDLGNYVFVPNVKQLHQRSDKGINKTGVEIYARNLKYIVQTAKSRGIAPVLSTFATCKEYEKFAGEERFSEVVAAMNAAVRKLAAEEGAPLIDLAPRLSDQMGLFEDWMHFNDRGEQAHAELVATMAKEAKLFGFP